MAIVLRLQRGGKKKEPHYRVVAIEKSKATTAQAKEILGHFHPCNKKAEEQLTLNMERVEYWLGVGAKASETVEDLIKKAKGEKPVSRTHKKVSKKAKEKAKAKAETAEKEKQEAAKAKAEATEKKPEESAKEEVKTEEVKEEAPKAEATEEPKPEAENK